MTEAALEEKVTEFKKENASQKTEQIQPRAQEPQLLDKVLTEFRALVAPWKLTNDLEAKRDAEAVMTFLLALEPALEEPLRAIVNEQPLSKKRISL